MSAKEILKTLKKAGFLVVPAEMSDLMLTAAWQRIDDESQPQHLWDALIEQLEQDTLCQEQISKVLSGLFETDKPDLNVMYKRCKDEEERLRNFVRLWHML